MNWAALLVLRYNRPKQNKRKLLTCLLYLACILHVKQEIQGLSPSPGTFTVMFILSIYLYILYNKVLRRVCLSVCLRAINSKTTEWIFMRFLPIDRVILPEHSGI